MLMNRSAESHHPLTINLIQFQFAFASLIDSPVKIFDLFFNISHVLVVLELRSYILL